MTQQSWHVLARHLRRLIGAGDGDGETDLQLLDRFTHQQDEAAFAMLLERHGPMVLGVCQRLLHDWQDAEDAFQATFCVLARKASSVSWQTCIGGWLYAVACRVAWQARAKRVQRQRQECEAATMRAARLPQTPTDPALRSVLDDELSRLPAKYREPLVLCYLEGKTNEEAARHLGWPKGSVQGRLARGRELLRQRLTKRGIAFSAGATGVAGIEPVALAVVPDHLREMAVGTAIHFATTQTLGSEISASVAALAEGVISTMFLAKMKLAFATIAMVLGIAVGASAFWRRELTAAPSSAASAASEAPGQPDAATLRRVPGGIASADDRVFFVTGAEGKIEAIASETGKLLWASASVGRPLLIDGQRLIAQVEQIDSSVPLVGRIDSVTSCRLGVLDLTQGGKELFRSDPLTLPQDGATFGNYFYLLDAQLEGGTVRVKWRSHSAPYRGGRAPSSAELEMRRRVTVATAAVNLESGRVEMKAAEKPAEVPARVPAVLKKVFDERWEFGPLVMSNRLVAIREDKVVEGIPPKITRVSGPFKLVFHSWDLKTAKPFEPITLNETNNTVPESFLTLDGEHLVICEYGQSPSTKIFNLQEGKRVELRLSPPVDGIGGRHLAIRGQCVYRMEQAGDRRTLKAMETKTGKVLWEHPLRPLDTYRGPPLP